MNPSKKITPAVIRQALRTSGFSDEVIDSALGKAKRWMMSAYGEINWDELENETGNAIGAVGAYAIETIKKPDGKKTFNRGHQNG